MSVNWQDQEQAEARRDADASVRVVGYTLLCAIVTTITGLAWLALSILGG